MASSTRPAAMSCSASATRALTSSRRRSSWPRRRASERRVVGAERVGEELVVRRSRSRPRSASRRRSTVGAEPGGRRRSARRPRLGAAPAGCSVGRRRQRAAASTSGRLASRLAPHRRRPPCPARAAAPCRAARRARARAGSVAWTCGLRLPSFAQPKDLLELRPCRARVARHGHAPEDPDDRASLEQGEVRGDAWDVAGGEADDEEAPLPRCRAQSGLGVRRRRPDRRRRPRRRRRSAPSRAPSGPRARSR